MTIAEIDRNIGKTIKVKCHPGMGPDGRDAIYPMIPTKRVRSLIYWEETRGGKVYECCCHRDEFTLIFEEARTRRAS